MMIDSFLQLSSNQALTGSAASEDTIDLTNARDIGIGEPLALVLAVKVAAGGTTPTLVAAVQVDSTSAFGSATTVATSRTYAQADMAAGAILVTPLPPFSSLQTDDPQNAEFNHLRVNYTMTGTTPTVTLDAQIMPMSMVQQYRAHRDGFTITG